MISRIVATLVIVFMVTALGVYLFSAEKLSDTAQTVMNTPVSSAMASTGEVEKQPGSIVLTGQDGTIVGQLARIPTKNEQISEIKTVSEVDKQGKRDLLSIVEKY